MAQTQQAISHWSVGRGRGRGSRQQQPYVPSRRPGESAMPPSKDRPSADAAQPYVPSRRPGEPVKSSLKDQRSTDVAQVQRDLSSKCSLNSANQQVNGSKAPSSSPTGKSSPARSSSSPASAPSAVGLKSGVTKLKAKFSYKANLDSPLGEKELTMKQGQNLVYLETCKDNEMWWKVQTEDKFEQGFVPSTYLEVVSDKVTQLPWLAAKQSAEESELPQCKPEWKPYVSAYNRPASNAAQSSTSSSSSNDKEQYYCKWCHKQLNGPHPYSAHINSKAHKEEVELAKEYGEYTED